MSGKPFDFNQQLKVGSTGEKALDAFYGAWFDITEATRDEQRQGIDRHWCDKLNGRRWAVEYKTDYVARRTHNAFIETVSVDGKRAGWVYTSQAQWLIYYVVGGDYDLAYMLDIGRIRGDVVSQWERQYPLKPVQNAGYVTKGLIVPLVEFEKHAFQVSQL
jgi:hypothetical protein